MSQLATELHHDAINNQIDGNSNVSPKKLSFKKKVKDQENNISTTINYYKLDFF